MNTAPFRHLLTVCLAALLAIVSAVPDAKWSRRIGGMLAKVRSGANFLRAEHFAAFGCNEELVQPIRWVGHKVLTRLQQGRTQQPPRGPSHDQPPVRERTNSAAANARCTSISASS